MSLDEELAHEQPLFYQPELYSQQDRPHNLNPTSIATHPKSSQNQTQIVAEPYYFVASHPQPHAFRVFKPTIISIPYFLTLLKADPSTRVFYVPGQPHIATVEAFLLVLDWYIDNPYPDQLLMQYPVTPHFMEALHNHIITLLSALSQAILVELALLSHFLGCTKLSAVVMSFASLKYSQMNLTQFQEMINLANFIPPHCQNRGQTDQLLPSQYFDPVSIAKVNTNAENDNATQSVIIPQPTPDEIMVAVFAGGLLDE